MEKDESNLMSMGKKDIWIKDNALTIRAWKVLISSSLANSRVQHGHINSVFYVVVIMDRVEIGRVINKANINQS